VAELLDRVSSEEITEWAAVFRLRNEEEEAAYRDADRRSGRRR
jgi:hypothetical protein